MKIFIYGLICPISKKIRYIGQSKNPKERLTQHISRALKKVGRTDLTHKERWIVKLWKEGKHKEITISIIEECCEFDCDDRELFWIRSLQESLDLTNTEREKKQGERPSPRKKGKPLSEETKEKIRKTKIGEKNPMFGVSLVRTEEWRKKTSESLRNSDALKKQRASSEYKKKLSDIYSQETYLIDAESLVVVKVYRNCMEIAKELGYSYANIKNARRDKRKIGKKENPLKSKFYIVYKKDYAHFLKSL